MFRTVYLVYYDDYEHVHDIEAIFDTKEQVEAFRNRFAENYPLKVIKKQINPKFLSYPDKIPYLVCFNLADVVPFEVNMLNSIEDCEKAGKNEIERTDDFIYLYFFANSRIDAINIAQNKLDEIINHK